MSLRAPPSSKLNSGNGSGVGTEAENRRPRFFTDSPLREANEAIVQPHTEISHRSSSLFSATKVAETIGTDLETIIEWLEVGAIDRAVFGGGRFSK
jgi:hypothetical protein